MSGNPYLSINTTGYKVETTDRGSDEWKPVEYDCSPSNSPGSVPRGKRPIESSCLTLADLFSFDSAMGIACQIKATSDKQVSIVEYDLHIRMDAFKRERMIIDHQFKSSSD